MWIQSLQQVVALLSFSLEISFRIVNDESYFLEFGFLQMLALFINLYISWNFPNLLNSRICKKIVTFFIHDPN